MNVALYARVSSMRQEIEETIETQIMAIKDFLKANNHILIQEYRDDGWSGAILARPALDQLRLDATKGLWEGIVDDPDRLSRKYAIKSSCVMNWKFMAYQSYLLRHHRLRMMVINYFME